jgi:hypothetical protein
METHVDQIADNIYRISTCIPDVAPGGFTFNQFLVDAEEPLLYHTGMRGLFPLVQDAVERLIPIDRRRRPKSPTARSAASCPSMICVTAHHAPWPTVRRWTSGAPPYSDG